MCNSKKPIIYAFLFFCAIWITHAQPQKNKNPVIGSWELQQYVDHSSNSSEWNTYSEDIIYQKHITDTHFIWVKYDKETDQLQGMGGGTYMIDNRGRYIENIQFFYPPGSSELGQSIPFEMYVNKDKWSHTGYAKNMEYNEDGELVVTDSTKIEEKWIKIADSGNKKSLMGTWDLISYREKADGSMIEYPDFIVYMKLITPTHFIWVKYDNEGDQIYASGSGPYRYDGKQYVEVLEVTYPQASPVNGLQIEFTPNVNANKWIHKKVIVTKVSDDIFIDEVWVPKPASLSEITAFIK